MTQADIFIITSILASVCIYITAITGVYLIEGLIESREDKRTRKQKMKGLQKALNKLATGTCKHNYTAQNTARLTETYCTKCGLYKNIVRTIT